MNRLETLRKIRGWDKKTAAKKIGMPYTTYIGYENGERGMDSEILLRLANFYDVTIDYLICNDEHVTEADIDLIEKTQILRDREDLRGLLDVTVKRTPEQIQKMIDLFGSMPEG